jgi:hypothetical protein
LLAAISRQQTEEYCHQDMTPDTYLSDDKDGGINYIVSSKLSREAEGKTASTSIWTEWRGLQPNAVWAT